MSEFKFALMRGELHIACGPPKYWRPVTDEERTYFELQQRLNPHHLEAEKERL